MIADLWEKKVVISNELRRLSGPKAKEAERDLHSKRIPRPCGITIHTGIGCSFGCVYCYVPDMGFPMRPRPYPLDPLQLVYALSINPYVIPRRTLAAFGSVTEPFLKETRERALAYMREVSRWLELPLQVSTKAVLDDEIIKSLLSSDRNFSVLVSVSVIGKEAKKLEPNAPPPEERLEGAGRAVKKGLKVTLFLRPIIPQITDIQAERIFEIALSRGVREVVLGTLRVTPGIMKRLKAIGMENVVSEIIRRLPRSPRNNSDQVTIRGSDLKKRISSVARKLGFRVLPSSCSANILAHEEWCEACNMGPCGFREKALKNVEREASELLEVIGIKFKDVTYDGRLLSIKVKELPKNIHLKTLIEVALRVKAKILVNGKNI